MAHLHIVALYVAMLVRLAVRYVEAALPNLNNSWYYILHAYVLPMMPVRWVPAAASVNATGP